MYRKNIVINFEYDNYVDKATQLVEAASRFESEIFIEKQRKLYNAKSIIGVLSIGANMGKDLTIMAEGEDEVEAVNKIVAIMENQL